MRFLNSLIGKKPHNCWTKIIKIGHSVYFLRASPTLLTPLTSLWLHAKSIVNHSIDDCAALLTGLGSKVHLIKSYTGFFYET